MFPFVEIQIHKYMYLCCICICTAFVFVFKSCRDYLLLSQKGRWTSRSQCYVFCILSWGWTDLPSSFSNTFFLSLSPHPMQIIPTETLPKVTVKQECSTPTDRSWKCTSLLMYLCTYIQTAAGNVLLLKTKSPFSMQIVRFWRGAADSCITANSYTLLSILNFYTLLTILNSYTLILTILNSYTLLTILNSYT